MGRELCSIFLVSLQNLFCINIAKFDICKVQRSQQAVPRKGIILNDQRVFQSKLMLLAAHSSSKAALAGGIFKGKATTSWDSEQE